MSLLDEKLPLPEFEHVLVHARLRGLAKHSGRGDYEVLAAEVLDSCRARNSISIVVPTFTYSFTKSLKFSVVESPSEVGRFSEEVRRACPPVWRTVDPIFSAIDVDDFGWINEPNLDAFGADSLWRSWADLDAVIVNLDLPHIVATQFHYIEKLADVPYRYDKSFVGEIVDVEGLVTFSRYNYYVRDLDAPSTWDRVRLEAEIQKAGKLHEFQWNGVRGTWFRAKEVEQVLLPIMKAYPSYLLHTEGDSADKRRGLGPFN